MLTLLTLNLNFYGDKHGPWAQRKRLIEQLLAERQPDVVALQAVLHEPTALLSQAEQLSEDFPDYAYQVFEPAIRHNDGRAEGLAVLSKVPIKSSHVWPLSLRPDSPDQAHRLVLHVELRPNGRPLHLFNGHFSWVYDQATDNLDETLPYISGFGQPGLLVGDFNMTPDTDLLNQLRQSGWTDAWAALRPDDPGYTFESNEPTIRIDYVWTNGCRATEIDVLSRHEDGVRLSDHLAVWVRIE